MKWCQQGRRRADDEAQSLELTPPERILTLVTAEGITNSHGRLIDIQLAMMRAAAKVIFCLDHTKFGRRSVSQLCDLSKVHTIVTDSQAPTELVAQLRTKGIEVITAA